MVIAMDDQTEETGVIICGGGPTGALLSAMLGRMKVPNVILEKQVEITTDPRGIALDEDGIRLLQAVGVYDKVFTQIALCRRQHIPSSIYSANACVRPKDVLHQRFWK